MMSGWPWIKVCTKEVMMSTGLVIMCVILLILAGFFVNCWCDDNCKLYIIVE